MNEVTHTFYTHEELMKELMEDELLTPQFIVENQRLIPIFDNLAKENSWQKILKNRH